MSTELIAREASVTADEPSASRPRVERTASEQRANERAAMRAQPVDEAAESAVRSPFVRPFAQVRSARGTSLFMNGRTGQEGERPSLAVA